MKQTITSQLKLIKVTLLTLLIMLAITTIIPLTAQAASDTGLSVNVEGEDFKVGDIVWDPNNPPDYKAPGQNATGWLLYLANTDGDIVSDIVYVHTSSKMPDTYITFLYAKVSYSKKSVRDLRPIRFYTSAPWGAPWNQDETSRASEIKAWLGEEIEQEGRKITNAVAAIRNYLGEEAYEVLLNNQENTYLVLEACANHEIIGGYKYGMYSTATAYGWIASEQTYGMHSTTGFDDLGNSARVKNDSDPTNDDWDTSWVDHKLLQRSVQLSENWEGLPAAPVEGVNYVLGSYERVLSKVSGMYEFMALRNVGLGMLAVKAVNTSSTSTYDESLITNPGPAPDDSSKLTDEQKSDSTKHANIVKYYQTIDKTTNTITATVCFTREITPKTIAIEDETTTTGYSIKDWFTSSSLISSLSYSECKNTLPSIQTGTTGGTVKLGDTETTLYLLLVRETGITPPSTPPLTGTPDFTLAESELTKPVSAGTKLKNSIITYSLGLLDPCKGHCGGHCSNTDVPHESDCVQCSVCGSSGSWGSQCGGTLPNGSPCTNTGAGWGYGLCTNPDHGTSTPCSDDTVKAGNCSHTQSTCTNPTKTTCGTFYECVESLNNTDLNFARTNTYRLHPLIALSTSFTDHVTPATHTRNKLAAYDITQNYNYGFVLTRSSIDPATIYSTNPTIGNTLASELFTSSIKYPNTPTRQANGVYTSKLTIQLDEDTTTQDKVTTAKASHNNIQTSCTATDTATIQTIDDNGTTITPVPKAEDQNVEIKVYKGVSTTPHTTVDNNNIIKFTTTAADKTAGRQVKSQATITFHPYIRMTVASLFTPKQDNI